MKNALVRHREITRANSDTASEVDQDAQQFRVNVIATTEEGTVAALRTASGLAANLGAQITLIAMEVVPWQCPLQEPLVPVAFLEQKLCHLVGQAGIAGKEVLIHLYLCRDQRQSLRKILWPRSVVVIGGQERWWGARERNLKKFLTSLKHEVIFAKVGASNGCGSKWHP